MAQGNKTRIILLKSKSSPADNYEDLFSGEKYTPAFVPVLDHVFTREGLKFLKSCLQSGAFFTPPKAQPERCYGGLIFTSQRAVEAFSQAITELRDEAYAVDELLPANLPIYVVGPATANGLQALNLPCNILGDHTGNGDVLAEFILENYNRLHNDLNQTSSGREDTSASKPGLLFLVGEQRRDVVPRTLQAESLPEAQRIAVDEITVYETAVKESFAKDFQAEVERTRLSNSLQWIVVFSPTGCKAMLEGLGLLNQLTGRVTDQAKSQKRNTFIATIGPTTQKYLIREFGYEPDVCSSAPSPEALLKSIALFESQRPPMLSE